MCGARAAMVQAGAQVGGGEQVPSGAGSRSRMQVRGEHRAQGWPGAVSLPYERPTSAPLARHEPA